MIKDCIKDIKNWITDMRIWLLIVWSIFFVSLPVWAYDYAIPCKSNMDVNDYIIHNPKYVQNLLKDYNIKFYRKLNDCYGCTSEDVKKISIMVREDVEQEQCTLGHEIGHVVANNLNLTKDKKMQRLWKKYGKDLISSVEPDNLEGIEYYTSTMDEGLAETYLYYLYHTKVPDNKFYEYYKSVLDAKTANFSEIAYK